MRDISQASRDRFRVLAPLEIDPRELLPVGLEGQSFELLLKAADVADEIFWQQVLPHVDRAALLQQARNDPELQALLFFHYGPYDRLDNDAPFFEVRPKLPGVELYPHALTQAEFTAYLESHPECRSSFESPYTVIQKADSRLIAVPYHEAYRDQVTHLSDVLTQASEKTSHPLFGNFLRQRAQDLLTDDYYQSDSLWVRLFDNPIDIIIGPYEVYEDQLMGLKAAYEAMVVTRDFAKTAEIQRFQRDLPSLCKSLEPKLGRSLIVETSQVEISVAQLIYSGGDARKGIPAIAFNLPNDERVVEEVGARQVILRNILEAKFRSVAWQIVNRLIQIPLDEEEMAFRNFLNHTLFHEVSHSIGPHRIVKGGETSTVNRVLRQHYSVLEEAKADTLAACFMLDLSDGLSRRSFLQSYVAGFLRSVRFGLSKAHGGANAIQFNYLLREGAIAVDRKTGKVSVNHDVTDKALTRLASTIIDIQERGDFDAAHNFVKTFCIMNSDLEELVRRVADLPIDIRIHYKST